MAAFRGAWQAGSDGIELDVRVTRDQEVVVFHDEDGSRLARNPRAVAACDSRDVADWRVGDQPVPRLDQVLAEAPANTTILVEIKSGPATVPLITRTVRGTSHSGIFFLSFDPAIAAMASQLSGRPAWLNVEPDMTADIRRVLDIVREMGLAGVSLGWSAGMHAATITACHAAGYPVAVWTINDQADARTAMEWGVDVLMTDDPSKMKHLRANHAEA